MKALGKLGTIAAAYFTVLGAIACTDGVTAPSLPLAGVTPKHDYY